MNVRPPYAEPPTLAIKYKCSFCGHTFIRRYMADGDGALHIPHQLVCAKCALSENTFGPVMEASTLVSLKRRAESL